MKKFQKTSLKRVQKNKRRTTKKTKKFFFFIPLKRGRRSFFRKLFFYCIGACFFIGIMGVLVIYKLYIADLPGVETIENQKFRETSIIYDKDGNELYNLYVDEKRRYVSYEDISENMIHAIIATEDKTFFTNPGVDIKGIIRAVWKYILWKDDHIQGTSTISQQLMKQVFFSNERSVERKLKEVYMSYLLNKNYTKEKILELYLNKISFGSNAYGVEQASQTFFGKTSSDLNILEASILASLPKAPTLYSPYNYRKSLMGYLYVFLDEDIEQTQTVVALDDKENSQLISTFIDHFSSLEFRRFSDERVDVCGLDPKFLKKSVSINSKWCARFEFKDLISLLNTFQIRSDNIWENSDMTLEYQTGRKDLVLGRMYEDGYIDGAQYQQMILAGLSYVFKEYREEITAPHFIFYIRAQLEELYGKEFFDQGGMKIYTTIDSEIQKTAEQTIASQVEFNIKNYDVNNSAAIILDNITGDVLAWVGSADYYNDDIDGKVDIITSHRQPGSSFKPLVYSLALEKNPISSATPIWDVPTKFGIWEPSNFDGKFLGKMSLKTALGYSRNIPAVKMFYLAGWEKSIVEYVQNLGINSIQQWRDYGAPLAIGTAELTPLELAQAYMVFANKWEQKALRTISKIVDGWGNIIYESEPEVLKKNILSPQASYLLWNILSDPSSRPNSWNTKMTLSDRLVATKTGTSNKNVLKWGEKIILPRDLWTVGYTPEITTVVWSGNTDGKAGNISASGYSASAGTWKTLMEKVHENIPISTLDRPEGIEDIIVSVNSGKLVPDNFSGEKVRTFFKKWQTPKKYDSSDINSHEIDILCRGKVTKNTPIDAIKKGVIMDIEWYIDLYRPEWISDIYTWIQEDEAGKEWMKSIGENILFGAVSETCTRPKKWLISLNTSVKDKQIYAKDNNYMYVNFSSTYPLQKLQLFLDNILVKEIPISGTRGSHIFKNIYLPLEGKHQFSFKLLDEYYYSTTISYTLWITKKDVISPEIIMRNPIQWDRSISLYKGDSFNLRADIFDTGTIEAVNIYINGKLHHILGGWIRNIVKNIDTSHESFIFGENTLTLEVRDKEGNKTSSNISVQILSK